MTTPTETLRTAGLRVTATRLAVLDVVAQQQHAPVEAIVGQVRARLGTVSTQAVYDVLRALSGKGLLRRVEPAGSPARYELEAGDNHHHLVCRDCGDIADVACAVGERGCLQASQTHGYVVAEAEVTWWGTCPRCQDTVSAEPSSPRPDPVPG